MDNPTPPCIRGASGLQPLPFDSGEAYLINRSGISLTLTALLPDDAEETRSLLLRILPEAQDFPASGGQEESGARERQVQPGEVAQFTLRRPCRGTHTSLFRLRKEGAPGSAFLKYSVESCGGRLQGSLLAVGSRSALGDLEQEGPHLLCLR